MEFSIEQIRQFIDRGYTSVAARYAKSALQHYDYSEEIKLEIMGAAEHEIKKQINDNCELQQENDELKEAVKDLLEMIEFIKRAYGHGINPEYSSSPLSVYIEETFPLIDFPDSLLLSTSPAQPDK